MKSATYRLANSGRLARAATFGMLALVATLCTAGEARAQWTQPDAAGNIQTTNTGNVGIGTPSPTARLSIAERLRFFDATPTGAAASTDAGFLFGTPILSGLVTEVSGQLTTYGINVPQIGARDGSRVGGFLRLDTRSVGVASGGQSFVVFGYPAGAPAELPRLSVSLHDGTTLLAPSGGSVGVGTAAPGYKFDVQGGAVNASGGLCIAGDCKTSWAQVGGSQWATSGSSLLYNSGNVGIATQTPATAKLVIGGTAGTEGLDLASADQYANLRVIRNSNSVFDKDLYLQYGAGAGSKIRFYNDNAESMTLSGGNLGVGTNAPAAKLDVNGDIRVSGNINAKYQDVAEWVPTTQKLAAGTVVVLDTQHSNHVAASHGAYDTRVAGVISAQPGISLGEKGEGKVLVATTGRVKVKVDATRAPIQIGDLIVTSDAEGVAMKSEPIQIGGRQIHAPGTIIGKALEPLEKGTGEILVLLSLQ